MNPVVHASLDLTVPLLIIAILTVSDVRMRIRARRRDGETGPETPAGRDEAAGFAAYLLRESGRPVTLASARSKP